jgi:hypothetical protein
MAPTIADCAPGVAIWLVWHVAGAKRLVYPCKLVDVLGSTGQGITHVIARSYQDNGYMEDAVSLHATALQDEEVIKAPARKHLDWAFRTSAIAGEADFRQVQPGSNDHTDAGEAGSSKRPRMCEPTLESSINTRLARCEELLGRQ